MIRDARERSIRFRFRLEFRLRLPTPSLSCLRARVFDRLPRGSRSPGPDGCSPLRASRSLVPPTSAGDPELDRSLLGRGDTEVVFSPVLDICFAVVAPRKAHVDRLDLSIFFPRLDLSALLMLPLSPDSLAVWAAIGLFDPLGLALLGGCLPLSLSLRWSTTRASSGYRAVRGTRSLDIPLTWCFNIKV